MILGITGHRPQPHLGGYKIPNPKYVKVFDAVFVKIKELNPKIVLSGMALGTDQLVCNVCIELGIPFVACVPFEGQEKTWPLEAQKEFKRLLELAQETIIVSEGGYHPEKMKIRNQYIVNSSDELLAVWSGDMNSGTYHCIQCAEKKINYKIHRINPVEL